MTVNVLYLYVEHNVYSAFYSRVMSYVAKRLTSLNANYGCSVITL